MLSFLLVLPPLLWAAAAITDKMLVDGNGHDSKPFALMAISGFFNLCLAVALGVFVLVFGGVEPISFAFLALVLNGATYVCAMLLFLSILKDEDVARVDPWFQTIPIFGIVGGYFVIGQLPGLYQILAIAIIILGGVMLSRSNRVAFGRTAAFMLMSAGLLAMNDVVFAKFGNMIESEVGAIFADVCGKSFWGLSLLLFGWQIRSGFYIGLRTKFKMQSISEMFAIAADFMFDWGKLIFPVAIVQATASTQPMFTLVGCVILVRLGVIRGEKTTLRGKVFWITVIVIGGLILAFTV